MVTIHFVRHGQTNYNAERRVQGQFDSVLTEAGILQAQQLQPTISKLGITAAWSSSNVRARHTAEILVKGLPLELECRDDLREIFMGEWQHRYWSEVEENDGEQFRYFMTEPDRFQVEGCETFEELQTRGVAAVEDIIRAESESEEVIEGQVLIVSHGAILKAILGYYANVPLGKIWSEPGLQNCSHSVMTATPDGERDVVSIAGESVVGTIWA